MNVPERSDRLTNRVAIVTGATRGIGEGIARRLAADGAAVVVSGRTVPEGREVVESIRADGGTAIFVEADLRSIDNIQQLFEATIEEFGSLGILVNNAAVQTESGAAETTLEEWNLILETNFRAYWFCAKLAYECMDEGSIINISSNHAFSTMPAHFPYNAVKAGIDGMTRAMALDFGPRVRVNAVNPGWVAVERTTAEMSAATRARLDAIHPLGRIGRPEDIAGVVSFLASSDSTFITGESILVDGGRGAVMQDDMLPNYRERREK
jgi:NAD(P)-dependent dehydrogenase (short-subunit alcohol dehydrogenase family)